MSQEIGLSNNGFYTYGGESFNMCLSADYCINWGLWEGLREFIQNHMDGMTKIAGKRSNIKVKRNDDGTHFEFRNQNHSELLGEIKYDPSENRLVMWNLGHLEKGDLLLGGQKSKNDENIGQFGEGMKIAALALIRLNKIINIGNGDEEWTFFIKEDEDFKKDNQAQKCLFWERHEYHNPGKVEVMIRNIRPNEWKQQLDRFTWLTSEVDFHAINTYNQKGEFIGQILFGEKFKNKIFAKDIYVAYQSKLQINFGLNAPFTLDRDRNTLVNTDEIQNLTAQGIAYILNNRNNLYSQYNSTYIHNVLDEIPTTILELLNQDNDIVKDLFSFINQSTADLIWDKWIDKYHSSIKDIQPDYQNHASNKMSWEKINSSFYKCVQVSKNLFEVLEKSLHYRSFDKKYEAAKSASIVKVPTNFQSGVDQISSIMSKICSFGKYDIQFRNYPSSMGKDFHYTSGSTIYFSSELFNLPYNTEWRRMLLGKCIRIKYWDLDYIKLVTHFNIIN